MNKSSPEMSETIYKAYNSPAPSIRAMVETQQTVAKTSFMNSMGLIVITMDKTKNIFRLMEITWDLEPEPFNRSFLNF